MESKTSELIFGLSEKNDGIMKLVGEHAAEALINRRNFFATKNIELGRIVDAGLIHGKTVALVDEVQAGQRLEATDGLITDTPNLFLTITVADCLPIYFFDPIKKVIGLAHAGWRGVLLNIAAVMVDKLVGNFQSQPQDLLVTIGPHLRSCHFIVQPDVADQFFQYQKFIKTTSAGQAIDLAGIVAQQLESSGVLVGNITVSLACTYDEQEKYFSFRRDKPAEVEAAVAYTGLLS
ncbi:MAG: peptidoglycan editing factor PgeF [Candidatus Komeilibacteria bacterium]|nr:peptidoglycan editing factor PgeF [Candidatus Komeilibacteria bacterium]